MTMRPVLLISLNFVRMQWLTVLIMSVYLLSIAALFAYNEQRQEVYFFFQSHAFYILFLGSMLAIPVLQAERKSRRIVAVLSKGIHRWQYLAGLWLSCCIITTGFSVMLGVIVVILCRAGNYHSAGLWPMTLALAMCCSMAAAVSLCYSVALHPLPAVAATTLTLMMPYVVRATDWHPLAGVFPVWWFSESADTFRFNGAPHALSISLSALLLTPCFLALAALAFARRDVTTSPE
jgi:ABC-type transport system involved in multi-copper enzyme maturation permease subunit